MRFINFIMGGAMLSGLSACSVHPLQQDVTGYKTVKIVDHIRCEARDALKSKIVTLLQEYAKKFDKSNQSKANEIRELALSISQVEDELPKRLRVKLNDSVEQKFYDRYNGMAIAFNFTFDITEDEKAGAEIDLLKPLTNGTLSLGLGGSTDFTRQNQRNFAISESFGDLLTNKNLDCRNNHVEENFVYPISGKIGLKELIDTFVDLNENYYLSHDNKNNPQVFADTLTFNTSVAANATAKTVLVSSGRAFQVAGIPLSGSASRVDKHMVIIGLSTADDKTEKGAGQPAIKSAFHLDTGYSAIGSAKQRALDATNNQRFNTFLDNFNSVVVR